MNIFQRLQNWIGNGADAASAFFDRTIDVISNLKNKQARHQAAFSIAMIALSAKMAKSDGVVTDDELNAFYDLFDIPFGEEKNIIRFFNLAKRDTAGFESYARRIARIFEQDRVILEDVMDGLFHIAKADGVLHTYEQAYLKKVAQIFGFDDNTFDRIKRRHIAMDKANPYHILGVSPEMTLKQMKIIYYQHVSECHPDRMIARGVPEEFIAIANARLSSINKAWEEIKHLHQ